MNAYSVILVTAKNKTEARRIAKSLLQKKLIACANIVDGVESWFSWDSKIMSQQEVMLVIKTRSALFKKVAARIKELHSYTTPEIIALPLIKGDGGYLKWINDVVVKGDV